MPESLKNILLVMANAGYLEPPDKGSEGTRLWDETWRRLDRFLPNLFGEVFPEQLPKARATVISQAQRTASESTEPGKAPL